MGVNNASVLIQGLDTRYVLRVFRKSEQETIGNLIDLAVVFLRIFDFYNRAQVVSKKMSKCICVFT